MPLIEYPVNQGVYAAVLDFDVRPDGFVAYCSNIIPSKSGILERRRPWDNTVYQVGTNISSPATYGLGMDNWNLFQLGEGASALAAAIWWDVQKSGTGVIVGINKKGGAGADNNSFAFNYTKPSFTEYNSIIYASTLAAGVRKITALNFATAAITEASVAGSPNLTGIMTFKNRLFGWSGNRVYYTDVPSIGGLPETWNTSANFFDVGGSKGTPTIHNILPVENRLYIFTDSGLYSVLISGPATTWTQRTVDETICIDDRYSCFVYKNLMYFADRVSVWVTDGTDFKDIGEPINIFYRALANLPKRHRVFRLNNHIVYSFRGLSGSSATSFIAMADFEVLRWGNVLLGNGGSNPITEVHGTLNDYNSRITTNARDSGMMASFINGSGNEEGKFVYLNINVNQDEIFGSNVDIQTQLNTAMMDFGEPYKYKRVNYVLIECEVYTTAQNVSPAWWVGLAANGANQINLTSIAANCSTTPNLMTVRVPGPDYNFKETRLMLGFSKAVDIRKIYIDYDISGDVEPGTTKWLN